MLKQLVVAAVCALCLCGCGPNVIQLTEVDNGRTISCSKGDQIVVTLPANPTTGYVWQSLRTPSSEYLVMTKSMFHPADDQGRQMVGVPGTYSFQYTVTGNGKEGICLIYCRIWEDAPPAGRFEVVVDARN